MALPRTRLRVGIATVAWLMLAPGMGSSSNNSDSESEYSRAGARLIDRGRLPLRTLGRFIVDKYGERVKWACINWYGSYSPGQWVVGGLEEQRLDFLVDRILSLGFNCIRLPYGTQTYFTNPVIQREFVEANPELAGKRFQDVFDLVVEKLTQAGLMIIMNNHISKDGWCCLFSEDEGLWYVPGWNETQWIDSLVGLATRYRSNPLVVAYDLRNEPHDYKDTYLTWGDGNPRTDLHRAMTLAGNAVLDATESKVLIVVEGLCFASDLRPVREHPIVLNTNHRVVYEVHNYLEFMDHTLFSTSVMSYNKMREICCVVIAVLVLLQLVLAICWDSLGRPCPPKGIVGCLLGWILIITAIAGYVFLGLIITVFRSMKACSYAVDRDWVPLQTHAILLFFAGVALNALGLYRMWPRVVHTHPRIAGMLHVTDSPEESDSGEEDSNFEYAGSRWAEVGCCSAPGFASMKTLKGNLCAFLHHYVHGQDALHDHEHILRRDVGYEMQATSKGAWEETSDDEGTREPGEAAQRMVVWDRGLCVLLTVFVLCFLLTFVTLCMIGYAVFYPSYWAMERTLDKQWGFMLEEGYDYTAPVWMGEFGETTPGNYWDNLMKYFSHRDIDWAYWPLNGRAYKDSERVIEHSDLLGILMGKLSAHFRPKEREWENETYGLLREDYQTVRDAWKLLDLQGIMDSPAKWYPNTYPCRRDALGPRCGG